MGKKITENRHLPAFFRDFHDQKKVVKAFYTFIEMRDTHKLRTGERSGPGRVTYCGWSYFHILLTSFLGFLNQMGYQLKPVPGARKENEAQMIDDLAELPDVWWSIVNPGASLAFAPDYCRQVMGRWEAWFSGMPEESVAAYQKLQQEAEAQAMCGFGEGI